MAKLEIAQIKPRKRPRLIDLLRAAGVDVSDWANCQGGEQKAASNPKYCYEWSFVEPKKLVVLNLWYANMQERDGTIVQDRNYRAFADKIGSHSSEVARKNRALSTDSAVHLAFKDKLPIRVVVCDGKMRDANNPNTTASQVNKRLLDPALWSVTAYDSNTGQCTITRGDLIPTFQG